MFVDGRSMCLDVVEGYKWRLEMVLRELTNEMLTFVQRSFTILSSVVDKLQIYQTQLCYQSAVVMTGCVGRPCFNVSGSQLKALIENRFSVTDIAVILGISVSTVRLTDDPFWTICERNV